jgi:hypothetical protein
MRENPKTVIALFAYGNIWPQTFLCAIRDCTYAAYNTARANLVRDLGEKGVAVDGALSADLWPVTLHTPHQDALIDRCRAVTAKQFLARTDADVLVMVDHDLSWQGATADGYEGDILHMARRCHERQRIVGAVISKKAVGQGVACLWREAGMHEIGKEGFVPVHYVGAALTCYPRAAIQAVSDAGVEMLIDGKQQRVKDIPPGFAPIFLPMVVRHPFAGQAGMPSDATLHLSEDWAFCHRAEQLGYPSEVALRPLVEHWGTRSFTVVGDALPPGGDHVPGLTPLPGGGEHPAVPGSAKPTLISLIHATRGRPPLARQARAVWMDRASGDHNLEYILSVDDDDPSMDDTSVWPSTVRVVRGASRGCVDAYNRGVGASSGQVIVQVHDDLEPPQNWDRLIVERMGDLTRPVLLQVDDGTTVNPTKPNLVTIAIMTRELAGRIGGMWHPGYVSVFCDDDLSEKAILNGWLIKAKDIQFHHHWGGSDDDDTKRRSYRRENWELGEALFARRKADGFPDGQSPWGGQG